MNVVILFADQQHKYALGKVDARFQTPHLDALADDGVLFTQAYSNNPVCGPFRGCLMTGLLSSHSGLIRNNMPLPEGRPTMAGRLRAAGWQTGFVGKWHLGGRGADPIPEPIRGGFEHFRGYQMYNGYDPAPPYSNRVAFFDEQTVEHVYKEHRTEVTTRLAVDMLDGMTRKPDPFCLVVGYQAPHYPLQPLPEYEKLYEHTAFSVPAEADGTEPYTPTFNPPSPKEWDSCPDYRRYGGDMQKYRRLYAAMVSQVDHGVGQIIGALKRHGLYDQTLIVYTSDHGDMQGSHGFVNKNLPYEMSAGIPMIARCPGGRSACLSSRLVSGVDIFATVMDTAHDSYHGDGVSFLDFVQGAEHCAPSDCILSESLGGAHNWQMIRTEQYKMVVSCEDQRPYLLFDMLEDPFEQRNLLDLNDDCRAIAAALAARLREKRDSQ